MSIRRVGFVATRLAGTDGVSLETAKWATVLRRLGYDCYAFAGEVDWDPAAAEVEPLAHFEHPDVAEVQAALFGVRERDRKVSGRVDEMRNGLLSALDRFIERFDIDLLIPENTLAIPMHVPLGVAVTQLVAETGIPVIAHHHDFAWERDRFRINACRDYLNYAFPPDLPSIRHAVINSYAAEQLSHRKGLTSTVVPNVWDFEQAPSREGAARLRAELGFGADDTLVLQPTRVVARKWIERAVEIVRDLGIPRLVISHAAGDEGQAYAQRLQRYAGSVGVELIDASHLVGVNGDHKPYTLDDAYQAADLVTYTSGYEGFGNAFVEAIYHRKPIVVNRYPVYVADIEPRGFDVIAIDGFADPAHLERIATVLRDPEAREKMTSHNFELGRRHFSYEVLADRLRQLIGSFER